MASRRPFSYPRFQAFDANGLPLASGTAEFFDAGTTNNRDIYSDAALTTTAPNPVTLNSRGEPESGGGSAIDIYLDEQPYKIVLKDSSGSTVWTIDNYIIPNSILEPQDPNDASDQGTDQYEGTLARDPSDGEVFAVDFQSANTTTTPTYENTDGSLGAKTMTTRDGSALWAGAVSGVHDVQRDEGADTYLVLEPIDAGVAWPTTSSSVALSFDSWRTPNTERPTQVIIDVHVETDGSTARVSFQVDNSGGTSSDFVKVLGGNSGGSQVVFYDLSFSMIVPAGASYQISNDNDPRTGNSITSVDEYPL